MNIWKIISGLELACIRVKPFDVANNWAATRNMNAHAAFFLGFSFFLGWHKNEEYAPTIENIASIAPKEWRDFQKEHVSWLIHLNPVQDYPYWANAQVWRWFYIFLIEKAKNIPK